MHKDKATPKVVIHFLVHHLHVPFFLIWRSCATHALTVVRWEQWFVPCDLLCTVVNMQSDKSCRPQGILGPGGSDISYHLEWPKQGVHVSNL